MQSLLRQSNRREVRWAVFGGIAAGAIDILYAFAANLPKGIPPATVLQSIASGFLGRGAYHGGPGTVILGGLAHFTMAVMMALLLLAAATQIAWVRRHIAAAGLLYGVLIYFGMRWVVAPLSRFPGDLRRFDAIDLSVHILGVGLVIALCIRRALAPLSSNSSTLTTRLTAPSGEQV